MDRTARPTAEEVIAKLKDDGDFDALRLKIIRKVKDNEDLRNAIILEVKQSVVLNADGSENMKPRQLSDAIYQELGSKIMGQISDEVWKVIRLNDDIKDGIKGTVEDVYKRLVNPVEEVMKDDQIHSPPPNTSNGIEPNLVATAVSCEPNSVNGIEPEEPIHDQGTDLSSKEELDEAEDGPDDAAPPGFSSVTRFAELQGGVSDEDPDVPPGFG